VWVLTSKILGTNFFKKPQNYAKFRKTDEGHPCCFLCFVSNCCEEFRSGQKLQKSRFESDTLWVFLHRDGTSARYAAVAEQLGMSDGALRMAVHRMRRRYRKLLRAEVTKLFPLLSRRMTKSISSWRPSAGKKWRNNCERTES